MSIPRTDLKRVAKGAVAYKQLLKVVAHQDTLIAVQDSTIKAYDVRFKKDSEVILSYQDLTTLMTDHLNVKDKTIGVLKMKNFVLKVGVIGLAGYIVYDKVIKDE